VAAAAAAVERHAEETPAALLARSRKALADESAAGRTAAEDSLEAALAELAAATGAPAAETPTRAAGALMRTVYLDVLRSIEEHVASRPACPEKAGEVRAALFKLCGDTIGHCLADLAIVDDRRRPGGAALAALSAVLGRGV
jgi:hypothetical protein